jgi:hypothetical protein
LLTGSFSLASINLYLRSIMSNDYAALLKSAKDIPVLSTGIENTVTPESTFPTKEHPYGQFGKHTVNKHLKCKVY